MNKASLLAQYLYLPFTVLLVAWAIIFWRYVVYRIRGDASARSGSVGALLVIAVALLGLWSVPGFKWP
jgi:hypothetical protein